MTSRETGGSSSEASHRRPAPLQHPGRPGVAVAGQDGVDPVAQQGAQPGQLRLVTQHGPQLADLRRRDPRLREETGAQQLREGGGTGLVVLQPCRGDRLALHGMDHVRLEAVVLKQLQQPPPAGRGLVRRRRARRQLPDHRQDRLHAVGDVAAGEHLAALIDHRHLGTLAVDVDPGVDRHRGPPSRARMPPGT
jgi:hypothetical protein